MKYAHFSQKREFFDFYDRLPRYGLEIQNESGAPKSLRVLKISAPSLKNWGRYWGSKKNFPIPSLKTETYDFRNFLHTSLELNYLKPWKFN